MYMYTKNFTWEDQSKNSALYYVPYRTAKHPTVLYWVIISLEVISLQKIIVIVSFVLTG